MKFRKIFTQNKTWVYSDPHFGHANICKFTDRDGNPMRPWDDVEEMDETMIRDFNDLVDPNDWVIFLGDLSMNYKGYERAIPRLVGKKILVKGNHDTFSHDTYKKHFRAVVPMIGLYGTCIMTHIPIHPGSIERYKKCLHGHTHNAFVRKEDGSIDERYINCCVENTDFKPVLLNSLVQLQETT